jgi:acetyl esterase
MSSVLDPGLLSALEDLTTALPRQPGRQAQWQETLKRYTAPPPAVASCMTFSVSVPGGGIPLRLYTPLGGDGPYPTHVFYPAGGFFPGNIETADAWCREICAGAGCIVVSVGYRVPTKHAPAYRCPTPGQDGYTALRWAVLHAGEYRIDAHRLSIGGESLGATVAALSAALASKQDGPTLCWQLLELPAADFTLEDDTEHYPSLVAYGEGYLLSYAALCAFKKVYLASPPQGYKGQASPLFAENLAHLPPTLLTTAAFDPLRDEGEAYGRLLRGAGVPVVTKRWPFFHGAEHLTRLPVAQEYREVVISTLRRAYGLPAADHASAPAQAR